METQARTERRALELQIAELTPPPTISRMKFFCSFVVPLLLLSTSTGVVSKVSKPSMSIPAAMCSAKVVFLGEASHGGGETIRTKVEMTQALIDRCRFNQVAFESQMYDFTALRLPHISVDALRNAVGGLWSTTEETDVLFEKLTSLANRKQIRLIGIDGQLGSSTSSYTQVQLAKDMSAGMPQHRARTCSVLTNRLTQWSFDDANPKDAQFDRDLKGCAEAFLADAKQHGTPQRIALANNFNRFLSFSRDTYVNDRDALMFENLQQSLASNAKTVVWVANIHAARKPVAGVQPLASLFDARPGIVSVGITAKEGSYCMPPCKLTKAVAPASAKSLELQIIRLGKQSRIVDLRDGSFTAAQPSKLLDYSKETSEQWSRLFDYVVVLPQERAPHHVRPASPIAP